MATTTRLLTYEDLLATPDDGRRYEIIGGELVVTAQAIPVHQQTCSRFSRLLWDAGEKPGHGIVYSPSPDVELTPRDIVAPDLVFVSNARRQIVTSTRIVGAPDLVVEVLSPSTRGRDLGVKRDLYARAGVLEYWWADHNARTIDAFALREGRYEALPADETGAVRSAVVPGLTVDPTSLFAGLWQ